MRLVASKIPTYIDKTTFNNLVSLLPEHRQSKLRRYQNIEDSYRSLFGELFAKWIISNKLNKPFNSIEFIHDKYGKPKLVDEKLHFNITHSGKWIVISVHNRPVGIDIEQSNPFNVIEIAETSFSEKEFNYLKKFPIDKRNEIFFELWTLKESWLKCIGSGLSVPPTAFSILPKNSKYFLEISIENLRIIKKSGIFIDEGSNYLFKKYRLGVNYPIGVCVNVKAGDRINFPKELEIIEVDKLVRSLDHILLKN